jgi:hypothetical protein
VEHLTLWRTKAGLADRAHHQGVSLIPPFHPARPHLVAPVAVDPTGKRGPTRGQAQGSAWRRSSHGLYVPADAPRDLPEQRIVEAAARLPEYGGVTGWAALRWWGGAWFDGLARDGVTELPVTLATGGITISRRQGVRISEERLDPDDLVIHDGLRLTTAVRSAAFEMRYASSERAAVASLDMAAYSDLVSIEEMRPFTEGLNGWTGVPQERRAVSAADENSWSLQETLMRLVWTQDADRPRPLCNVPVFDRAGRHLGTPDLLDVEAGLVGEYDGALHLAGTKRADDVRREDRLRGVGLEIVTMLAADRADPVDFLQRLHAAYSRARYEASRPAPGRSCRRRGGCRPSRSSSVASCRTT